MRDADIEAMSLEAVQRELRSYEPSSSAAVERSAEHIARRARLWARLDQLLGIRKPAIAG
jgi:hypothetical protein